MTAHTRAVSPSPIPGASQYQTLTPREKSMDRETIRLRGNSGCRSAKPPSRGWHTMPARQRTEVISPASPLEKPRSSSRAVWYPTMEANMAQKPICMAI